jgi:phosphoribosylanthranilate isomerase
MRHTRVKICGLTRLEDLESCISCGADAVGFVFVPQSPRFLSVDGAETLCRTVPAFVSRVGLFLDQDASDVHEVLQKVPLSLLQFHGREDEAYCQQFGLPYIKAISMDSPDPVSEAEKSYPTAAGILVDSHEPGGLGGTGRLVNWNKARAGGKPLILAGGLSPDNVADAVRKVNPWAVDVSSGVESSPGIKSAERIKRFIEEAKSEQ